MPDDGPPPFYDMTAALQQQIVDHTSALEDLTRTAEHLMRRVEVLERERDLPGPDE
ncbi:MAG: hypothetical protein ACQSGP_24320 [Frankia sp.]